MDIGPSAYVPTAQIKGAVWSCATEHFNTRVSTWCEMHRSASVFVMYDKHYRDATSSAPFYAARSGLVPG